MRKLVGVTAAALLAASGAGCRDGHEKDGRDDAARDDEAAAPVAGTGALVNGRDPADALFERTYVVEPMGGILLAGCTGGVAAYTTGEGGPPVRIATVTLPGSVSGLAVLDGQIVAACTGPSGVVLLDAGRAAEGRLEVVSDGGWITEGGCHAAWNARRGPDGRIYVACGTSGVAAADVSDPASARVTRLVATGGYVRDVAVLQDGDSLEPVVVAAAGAAGLVLLELDPGGETPVLARLDTPGDARAVAVSGHLAFAADGPGGLVVTDLTDPSRPRVAGTYDPRADDMARGVVVDEDVGYLLMGSSGLAILDLSEPSSPAASTEIATGGAFNDAVVTDGVLYGANDDAGLVVVDVSDPASARLVHPDRR